MAVVDHEGLVVAANDALAGLLGAAPAALAAQSAADLLDLAADGRTWHAYREVLHGRRPRFRCTRELKHSDGRSLWAEITVVPMPEPEPRRADRPDGSRSAENRSGENRSGGDRSAGRPSGGSVSSENHSDENRSSENRSSGDRSGADRRGGDPCGPGPCGSGRVLLSVADISDRRELQKRLRHLRMHDPVTGLPNRTLFFERLSAVLETPPYRDDRLVPGRGRIGLCYLDLDGFKAVNDSMGHRIGDQLLEAVATRLTACAAQDGPRLPGAHLVARLGGDEFAILIEDSTGTQQLTDLARRALAALRKPFDVGGRRLSVSASIGVVERPVTGTSATGLMQAADTTLYWAKADGKDRWTLFDPERNAHRMTRQTLSSHLRPAVERGEFTIEYQPLVGMADGVVRGVEALVRWNHPQFGMLSPNRFVAIAEEDGSIVQLGRWVLRSACRQARRWQLDHPAEPPLFISVNVAVRQVWDSDLVTDVAEILAETGLDPGLLQLELTESAVMGSAGRPLQALQSLSDMGVRIAIDDFGTGYSNLAYLSRLPVSVLKLDGSFVRGFRYDDGAHASPADETIVEAMVHLAHRLGLTVTAECVETAGQAERLRSLGCDTGQGWLYSRAVGPERIAELIGRRKLTV
ncbi:putative bifunctional diguanylate cyclase/phosphodiesterase [Streptomyces sp. NPDC014734]|uniref:putative bifunctional diguanylate cyclase/phosphodiesterase n=1 Tax=Streptomyces sp. NPDC014734 TaxID=3364886 RepID=UPI0036F4D0D1